MVDYGKAALNQALHALSLADFNARVAASVNPNLFPSNVALCTSGGNTTGFHAGASTLSVDTTTYETVPCGMSVGEPPVSSLKVLTSGSSWTGVDNSTGSATVSANTTYTVLGRVKAPAGTKIYPWFQDNIGMINQAGTLIANGQWQTFVVTGTTNTGATSAYCTVFAYAVTEQFNLQRLILRAGAV